MEVGGDFPFVRRIVGITVCNLVGSVYNEGIWVRGQWTGMEKKRTPEGNRAWAQEFNEGGRSRDCRGCTGVVVLRVCGSHICLCCLHLCMAMSRLLVAFVKWAAGSLTSRQQAEVDVILRREKTGLRVKGSQTPDGEEGYRLLHCWEDLGVALGTSAEVDEAVLGMRDLLRDLYVTFLPPVLPKCKEVAKAFRAAMGPDTMSSYLFFLEEDADWLLGELAARGPYGLAMFSGDVLESFNRLLKISYNDHSNRGAQWGEGEFGALDATGDVLRQVMEWIFLWFHVPLAMGTGHRVHQCRAQEQCE